MSSMRTVRGNLAMRMVSTTTSGRVDPATWRGSTRTRNKRIHDRRGTIEAFIRKECQIEKTKIVHFVRHAEGVHNVAHETDPISGLKLKENEDAWLTNKGLNQCIALRDKMIDSGTTKDVDLLVVSPMRRTLQTAIHSFPHLMGRVPWLAHESLRERFNPTNPCDQRRSTAELKKYFPSVDFSSIVDPFDPLYSNHADREPETAVGARANNFLAWLSERREKEIIVVTHGGYLFHMVNQRILQIHGGNFGKPAGFGNCEMRSYEITF